MLPKVWCWQEKGKGWLLPSRDGTGDRVETAMESVDKGRKRMFESVHKTVYTEYGLTEGVITQLLLRLFLFWLSILGFCIDFTRLAFACYLLEGRDLVWGKCEMVPTGEAHLTSVRKGELERSTSGSVRVNHLKACDYGLLKHRWWFHYAGLDMWITQPGIWLEKQYKCWGRGCNRW